MRTYRHVHVYPLTPARMMKMIDEDPYRQFMAANMPDLAAVERLEFRWEGEKRIKRIRMQFETPLPALLKKALPTRGMGWVEEVNILYPKEGRAESHVVSSVTESWRVTHFKNTKLPGETEYIVEGRYHATIPVVRGALERFMAREIEKHEHTEFDMTMRFLREHLKMAV